MSQLPVFEDTVWRFTRHRGRLQYFTDIHFAGRDYRIVMTLGAKKLHVDLFSNIVRHTESAGRPDPVIPGAAVRHMTMTTNMFNSRLVDIERFAFGSVVYYLTQATPLVDAIQDPLPYWQH